MFDPDKPVETRHVNGVDIRVLGYAEGHPVVARADLDLLCPTPPPSLPIDPVVLAALINQLAAFYRLRGPSKEAEPARPSGAGDS